MAILTSDVKGSGPIFAVIFPIDIKIGMILENFFCTLDTSPTQEAKYKAEGWRGRESKYFSYCRLVTFCGVAITKSKEEKKKG